MGSPFGSGLEEEKEMLDCGTWHADAAVYVGPNVTVQRRREKGMR
jgi:hypothetical protein